MSASPFDDEPTEVQLPARPRSLMDDEPTEVRLPARPRCLGGELFMLQGPDLAFYRVSAADFHGAGRRP